MKWWLVLCLALYGLDQSTKALVLKHISQDESIPVIPGVFNLVQVHNTGAAFGMMRDNNWFFVALAAVALAALATMALKGAFHDLTLRWATAMLVAGIAGNLTDRLAHGYVVDFLDVVIPFYGHWPSFNVADSCICVAAFLFVCSSFRSHPAKAQPAA